MTKPDLTRVDPRDLINAALTGPCDGCGSSEALYVASRFERYCVACHTRMALYEAAETHLYALLEPAFTAWANHTRQLLSTQHLNEVLSFVHGRFEAQLEASEKEAAKLPAKPTDWTV